MPVQVLTTSTALTELQRMLADGGFEVDAPSLSALWPVLTTWAAQPVQGMDPDEGADLMLFEGSLFLKPSDVFDDGWFALSFTRQFSFGDVQGEYSGMEHVTAELRYAVNDDFRAIAAIADWNPQFGSAGSIWGEGGPRATEWAAQVEASPSYNVAMRHEPMLVWMEHSPV
jgi:hypothetical protein